MEHAYSQSSNMNLLWVILHLWWSMCCYLFITCNWATIAMISCVWKYMQGWSQVDLLGHGCCLLHDCKNLILSNWKTGIPLYNHIVVYFSIIISWNPDKEDEDMLWSVITAIILIVPSWDRTSGLEVQCALYVLYICDFSIHLKQIVVILFSVC
jgi:hypothetical protein